MKIKTLLLLSGIYFCLNSPLLATPFPVKGDIFDSDKRQIGIAHVYPRYVEIYNINNSHVGKVGILVENGLAKLFLVSQDNQLSLVGVANRGRIYNKKNKFVGSYVWTPTYSYVYNIKGKRAGSVKCIAWPRVCAAAVGGYLLKLFGDNKDENSP